MRHRMSIRRLAVLTLGLFAVVALMVVQAQSPTPPPPHGSVPAHAPHFEPHYGHGLYYAPRGAYVSTLPAPPVMVGGHYYSGGVWYAPRGPGFVVVTAPVGVFVPVLPPFYTTLWIGGFPYYYANDTYYTWRPDQSGYEVVAPPADPNVSLEAPASDELFIYPQNGQSPEQQSSDQFDCHKWASAQTGFDPTVANGGVAPDQSAAKHTDYQNAMRACLEGRGYSVR